MTDRNERDRDEARERDGVTDGKDQAAPDADPDRGTAYDSSTSGGAVEEIQDGSDTPHPSQRGRDLDH